MRFCLILILFLIFGACSSSSESENFAYPDEKHFAHVRQITFGGDNAEAYWSPDGSFFSFQSNNAAWGLECDQIFYLTTKGENDLSDGHIPSMISTGKGRTTCAYVMPDNAHVLYASTHLANESCPPNPERTPGGKYLWPIDPGYDIFVADLKGQIVAQLTDTPGYDAEATISPNGDLIVFTSLRNGDLDLYTMDLQGGNVTQVTNELGYDGGAFFSPDGSKLVFRASRFQTEEAKAEYLSYLEQGLVAPTEMEIFICNVDGTDLKQITQLGKANWAPFYHPSGNKILFSSNHKGTRGFEFNIYMINEDGSGLEQVTYDPVFDSFPMFSPDGTKLIFSSNRNNGGTRDTNLFIADWVE